MRQAAFMTEHVHPSVLLTGELLVTEVAGEGFLSGVEPVVGGESFLLLEGHGACVTFIRMIFQMPGFMIF